MGAAGKGSARWARTHQGSGADQPSAVRLVTAANGVEIVGNQGTAYKKCLGSSGFLAALLLDLDRALMGLPVTGDTVEDLMGAFAAGAESVGAGHCLALDYQGLHL